MKKVSFIICLFLVACHSSSKITTTADQPNQSMIFDGKLFTALYQQQSAEYKALCLQAYNFAANRLNEYKATSTLPKVIITDIDETVLDNSPFAVHQGLLHNEFDYNAWFEWTSKSIADTVPGAPAFLKLAASKGVEIFYITNRDEKERESTLRNLSKYNLPNTDNEHLILKTNGSSKESRRQQVAATHEIVMLVGDNLGDFSYLFDKKSTADREKNVNFSLNDFGKKFIVIPNPGYGDWEGALLNYNYKLTAQQKDSVYKAVLKNY